jgi:hypothetical protein
MTASDRSPYLEQLLALPFVRKASLEAAPRGRGRRRPVTTLQLTTPRGQQRLRAYETGSHLSQALVGDLVARAASRAAAPAIVFAPYVSPEMGARLAARGIAFVDRVGNCHLDLGGRYVAHVEGRRRERAPAHIGLRAASFRLVFAILVDPALLNRPLREVARASGVSLGTASSVLRRLEHDRIVVRTRSKRHLAKRDDLVERWTAGYADALRPQIFVGRFETPDADPPSLERRAEAALGPDTVWAWGGAAAAFRLTRHYRSDETVLHIDTPGGDLLGRLRAVPHPAGRFVLLGVPGPLAFWGRAPRTVHPLLAYTELVLTGTERARQTASEIRQRFLADA